MSDGEAHSAPDEASFRALLDDHGVLRPGIALEPPRDAAYLVFAQRPDARIALVEWQRHAATFFATRLGLTTDKRYGEGAAPRVDAARIVVATERESGARIAFARPREERDLVAADEADARAGGGGLAQLARRCSMVWLVATEHAGDRVALRIAGILAGVLLGPIVAPSNVTIFGPKTAREELAAERPASPA